MIDTKDLRSPSYWMCGSKDGHEGESKLPVLAADEIDALRVRLEAAENDAAHQKALAESALRVAEGWERKCGELRSKVEEMEKQGPAAHVWRCDNGHIHGSSEQFLPMGTKLYIMPGAQQNMLKQAVPGAQPAPGAQNDMMRDARRYNWLRNDALHWYVGPEYSTYNDVVCSGECCNLAGAGIALDSRIDAMLAEQEGKR